MQTSGPQPMRPGSALWLWGPLLVGAAILTSTNTPLAQSQPRSSDEMRQEQLNEFVRLIYLSGRVILENGSPPPGAITVTLQCDGRTIRQSLTERNGNFSLGLGSHKSQSFVDASVSGSDLKGLNPGERFGSREDSHADQTLRPSGLGRVDMTGCSVLVPAQTGFSGAPVSLGIRSVMDKQDIGEIVVRPIGGGRGTMVSLVTLSAPTRARKFLDQARLLLGKQPPNLSKAKKQLLSALDDFPGFAEAWYLLGKTRLLSRDLLGAKAAFEKAAEADPGYWAPLLELLRLAVRDRGWDDVGNLSTQLISMSPGLAHGYYFKGLAHYSLSELLAAQEVLEKGLALEGIGPHTKSLFLIGVVEAKLGRVLESAEHLRAYLRLAPDAPEGVVGEIREQLRQWKEQGVLGP